MDPVFRAKAGPFSWIVPLREITSIEPTRNPASSPARSLDRLLVRYGGGEELMVSPGDKAGFMAAIKKQLKKLESAKCSSRLVHRCKLKVPPSRTTVGLIRQFFRKTRRLVTRVRSERLVLVLLYVLVKVVHRHTTAP